jgi:hypothetical protein
MAGPGRANRTGQGILHRIGRHQVFDRRHLAHEAVFDAARVAAGKAAGQARDLRLAGEDTRAMGWMRPCFISHEKRRAHLHGDRPQRQCFPDRGAIHDAACGNDRNG